MSACNGICIYANELIEGAPLGQVAYAHPDCEKHSEPAKPSEESL